jgi:hypothetical protein
MMRYPDRRSLLLLVPVLVAGTAAVAVAGTIDAPVLRSVLQAIAVAAFLAIAWYVGLSESEPVERGEAHSVEITSVQATALAADRRRPTFDRDTGLHATWYFRLRVEEEIARATRYGQPLTLLCLTGSTATLRRLVLKRWLRQVDFAGDLGDVIAVVLPNTDRNGASILGARIEAHVPEIEIRVAEYPVDGTTLAQLLGESEWHVAPEDLEAAV